MNPNIPTWESHDFSRVEEVKGSFGADRIGEAVDGYTAAFVLCSECGLPDTRLERENGVELLRCEACGARSATPDDDG